jgi:hypothetical protein
MDQSLFSLDDSILDSNPYRVSLSLMSNPSGNGAEHLCRLSILFVLTVVGYYFGCNTYIPMDAKIKNILNIAKAGLTTP